MNEKQHGLLAKRFCGMARELEVLKSAAGFYIGTHDPALGPVSRESQEYWKTEEKAATALRLQQWTQRQEP